MLGFMDYVQQAFSTASNWDRDNSYGSLTATAHALLDFPTPHGLQLNLSSLSSPNSATSYTLSSIGAVDGSLSYLYSSLPIRIPSKSTDIPLRHLIQGYRRLPELRRPDEPSSWEIWHQGKRVDRKATLLYGRLYLPTSHLEALYLRRLNPSTQLKVSCVSASTLRSGGSVLFLLSQDKSNYSQEYLYSTDSALLGFRGLYNFGPGPRISPRTSTPGAATIATPPSRNGRFSFGGEAYYGLLDKSGGLSAGLRFTTLPAHTGFPYTMTLTLNPLMGSLSTTYAVRAGSQLALCSRFDFNVYSYESALDVGVELWRRRLDAGGGGEDVAWARERIKKNGWEAVRERGLEAELVRGEAAMYPSSYAPPSPFPQNTMATIPPPKTATTTIIPLASAPTPTDGTGEDGATAGVLKARMAHTGALSLLWEGRANTELLYSAGVVIDFRRRENMFRGVGLEVRYSS